MKCCQNEKFIQVYCDKGDGFRCFSCNKVVWEHEDKETYEKIKQKQGENGVENVKEGLDIGE